MKQNGYACIPPSRFTEPLADEQIDWPICWVQGRSIVKDRPVFVPADLAFGGYRPKELPASAFKYVTSNGLAAAFARDQAILHGLREVMERDAVSCVELEGGCFDAGLLEGLATAFGISTDVIGRSFVSNPDVAWSIQASSLPSAAIGLVERFRCLGVDLSIKYLPNDFGLPIFGAAAIELLASGNYLGGAGYGVNLDPDAAVVSAILEIAQVRSTSLQGSREDYHEVGVKSRLDQLPVADWMMQPSRQTYAYSDVVRRLPQGNASIPPLQQYLDRLLRAGLQDVIVIDFPVPASVCAVRVLVPDAETTHSTHGRSRLGTRATRRYRSRERRH